MTWDPKQVTFADSELPPLRQDLTLLPGPQAADGSSTWTLHDAPANRFYRIGIVEYAILNCWTCKTPNRIIDKANKQLPFEIDTDHVKQVLDFLEVHSLVHATSFESKEKLLASFKLNKAKNIKILLNTLMSIRIPLFRCDAWLTKMMPYVEPLFSLKVLYAFIIAGIGALLILMRHWDEFIHTFSYFFNVKGLLIMSCTVMFSQALHELGHAFTAKKMGIRVPAMGLSFFLFCPILYTDTNEAWKLKSRKQRIAIGIAGVAVEMALAVLAAYAWVFLDDGVLKTAAFMIVSMNTITTLLVNLNPLMRFDGYYLFSDILDVENMQDRSLAMIKWFSREHIVGLGIPAPEQTSKSMKSIFIGYGFSLLIYRIGLYAGMAYTIYMMSFKLLGIALFVYGIYTFFCVPAYKEGQWYWLNREKIKWNKQTKMAVCAAMASVIFLCLPWKSTIKAPAILKTSAEFTAYAPRPTVLQNLYVKNGQKVKKGDVLMVLEDPALEMDIATAKLEIAQLVYQIQNAGSDENWQRQQRVLREDVLGLKAKLDGLKKEKNALIVKAPFKGVVTDINHSLKAGASVKSDMKLAMVIDPSKPMVEAYVNERDMAKVEPDADGVFRSVNGPSGVDLRLKQIDVSSTQLLSSRYLVSDFGGSIAAAADSNGNFQAHDTIYRLILYPTDDDVRAIHKYRGTIYLDGAYHSIAGGTIKKIITVLIRELGF